MNDFGFSIRPAAVGVDAGCWLPLIYFLKMKQRCNTGGNRAHPHDQEKSSGNSEADKVRVGGSSFYKGMLGDSIQPLLPGKSGLGFQPRPGAPSMPGACAWSAVTWRWSKSKTGSQARVGHTCVLGHRSHVETGVASWEGANKEINLEPGFEGVGW